VGVGVGVGVGDGVFFATAIEANIVIARSEATKQSLRRT